MAHIVWDQSGCHVILLLYRPVLAWLRRDKGEELADEIMAMVEEGEESGAIEQNEKELIANIFEFNSIDRRRRDASPHRYGNPGAG